MPNGYVSQIQINGGDVQNIGSCAYAVCDTAEDVSVKVVTLPGFVLKDGATIHVKFMYRNIAFNPKLNVNGTGGKTILLNTNSGFDSSLNLSSQYNVDQLWMAGAVVTLTYDGTYWVVNNPSRITSPYTYNLSTGSTLEPGSYMILADIEWELCNGSSSATARVFPFKVCMSTMVDGLYRDRSAIMEVFVGGSYNKKDYVDIMIHDESEYHVNGDYVFDSLVDSIFIYFEYEVSSSNVIGKRTGHLLGKVPSRWSSFQLVPLTNMSVSSANPDEDHHFLKLDIAHSASSFVPSETSQTSIPSGNVLPTTVGVHRYLIKARMKPFDVGQISGVLPIEKGGTGATTAIGAEYNILNQVADINTTLNDDRKIALCNQTKSASNGVFRWIKLSNVWNWIKSKADELYWGNNTINMSPMFNNNKFVFNSTLLNDYLYGANVRFRVTWKTYDSSDDTEITSVTNDTSLLFNGNNENFGVTPITGQYDIITIDTESGGDIIYHTRGFIVCVFYYKSGPDPSNPPIVKIWTGSNMTERTLTATAITPNGTDTLQNYYVYKIGSYNNLKKIQVKIIGKTQESVGAHLANLYYIATRSSTGVQAVVTKHANEQQLYGKITAPSFIKRGGTSSQLLAANGDSVALPLAVNKGGTGATNTKTARLNLLSDATEAATDASDGNLFAFRYQTPSADNGAIYYRTADKVWNWIIGKITAGTGLSKSGNTINHSNSVTAQTSNLGSSVRIPAIKYDAQGHITYGTYYSVFSSDQYSAVKCGYVSNGKNGAGWYKIADITYWDATYNRYDVIISVVGTGTNAHDVGLLRIRGINAATAGVITGVNMGWIYKTPGTSNGFATNCIRATKTETNSSSGATLSLFIYIPVNDVSYNFLVLNEGIEGASSRGHKLIFVNSITKQTTEPAPTYTTNFLPLEIGNQSNCLEITDSNWQSYLTASNAGGAVPSSIANGDILTIPEGVSQVFFNTTNEASIALVRGASTLNRFPRNGVRITIAGNWKPQENGGYSGGNAVGRFSAYLYVYRGGVASSSANYRMTHAFEDFMYFNGIWYSKGY